MKMIWSKDVTIEPRGKVELWYKKWVQESTKTVISYCINNLLKVANVGYTKQVQKNKLNKVCLPSLTKWIVGAEKI